MPVHIYMHHKEASRRSNSAHLLKLALTDVVVDMHGVPDKPTRWPSNSTKLPICVLFPNEEATELRPEDVDKFGRLVILDGNWRQAKKAANRIAQACAPVFKTLPIGLPSEFKLRKQSDVHRLSTYEAAARALSILEEVDPLPRMMPLFHAHVDVTLNARSRRNWAKRNAR